MTKRSIPEKPEPPPSGRFKRMRLVMFTDEMDRLHAGVKRFVNPHQYPVGLEKGLFDLRTRLILQTRRVPPAAL